MYSLLPYNTFGIDVSASRFLEYASVAELKEYIAQGAVTTPFLHIGGGSNLLFTKDYDGLILHSRVGGIEVTAEDSQTVSLRVGAGVVWDDFVACCVEHGWYGAENLSLIPGEVGASAVQNIGAYGVEVKDLITAVETTFKDTGVFTLSKNASMPIAAAFSSVLRTNPFLSPMSASVLVKKNGTRWTMERFARNLQGILHRRCPLSVK